MAAITDPNRRHWTAADLRAIPDDRNRYEIVDGELLVTPSASPAHQTLSTGFFRALDGYVEAHRIGKVIYAPADVVLADDTVVEPDLFVFPLLQGGPPVQWDGSARLLLVIEILSPGTARADRTIKRNRYQREGIPEYWIVDGDARVVERWRPEDKRPEIVVERLAWMPDSGVAPLIIDLPALFVAALGTQVLLP